MDLKNEVKENKIATGIWVVFFYGIAMYFISLPLLLLRFVGFDYTNMSEIAQNIYIFCYEVLMIMVILPSFMDKLDTDLTDLKKNHQVYFKKYFKLWFLLLFSVSICNYLINLIHPGIAGNQEAINDTLKSQPVYMYLSAILIAPILEELVFRQAIRYIFKSDFWFIMASGLAFGLLHVVSSYQVPLDLLYVIPYGIPGGIFAYVLSKTDNIYTTMFLHFVHNSIEMSLLIFMMIFM